MTEFDKFVDMLKRAGIGHGLRRDYNPPGTAVLVEADGADFGQHIAEFTFNDRGQLLRVGVSDANDG